MSDAHQPRTQVLTCSADSAGMTRTRTQPPVATDGTATTRRTRLATKAIAAMAAAAIGTVAAASPSHAAAMYTLSYQTLTTNQKVVARWNPCQTSVKYRVNLAQSASTSYGRYRALVDVKAAIARLSYATGIRYQYLGTTKAIPTGVSWWRNTGDAELVVAWVNQNYSSTRSSLLLQDSRGWLAGTAGWQSWRWGAYNGTPAGTAIVRGYVVLNAAQRSAFAPGFGSGRTRGELLIHELGHTVGLNHVATTSQIMYPYMIKRASASYQSGDRSGLAKVGRSAGCIKIPTWSGAPADL